MRRVSAGGHTPTFLETLSAPILPPRYLLCEPLFIMPSRTRQAPVEEPEEDSGLHGLAFNQPLSWRVGRAAIPIADLLDRLQTLAQELRKLEQEEIDKELLRKVSQELSSANLLAHKDKGVRAWATCCIVDVLRLCAPDAPFTRNQLKVRPSLLATKCPLTLN